MKKLILILTMVTFLVACGGSDTKVIQGTPTNGKDGTEAEVEKVEKENTESKADTGYVFFV